MRALLDSLHSEFAWGTGPSTRITENEIAAAAQPLTDAGWRQAIEGLWIRWEAPRDEATGIQFDAFPTQALHSLLPTWTVWGGHAIHQPTWALCIPSGTPAVILKDLAFELPKDKNRTATPLPPHFSRYSGPRGSRRPRLQNRPRRLRLPERADQPVQRRPVPSRAACGPTVLRTDAAFESASPNSAQGFACCS
ncbi:DUF317 domain-containing protein [Streptomyces sp. NPDC006475]|uniref:DUF317 domain-containing protein n=1 Tax=Streptomyces sp. NPDC006475 TaxID=3155719 RepID=UPI0033BF3287